MKKALLVGLLVCSTVIAGGIGSLSADAAIEDTHKSTSEITITAGEGVTDPLEPGEDDEATGHAGSLTIDNVTNFTFGEHELSTKKEIYVTTSARPNVQVTDKRGSGAGWNLNVASTNFSTVDGTELKGAFLTFGQGRMGTTEDNTSTAPTASPISFEFAGSAQTIISAAPNEGLGTWVNRLFNDEDTANLVSLEVPSGNKIGNYTAELDWNLSDAP